VDKAAMLREIDVVTTGNIWSHVFFRGVFESGTFPIRV
jgi:hypothetical protein